MLGEAGLDKLRNENDSSNKYEDSSMGESRISDLFVGRKLEVSAVCTCLLKDYRVVLLMSVTKLSGNSPPVGLLALHPYKNECFPTCRPRPSSPALYEARNATHPIQDQTETNDKEKGIGNNYRFKTSSRDTKDNGTKPEGRRSVL